MIDTYFSENADIKKNTQHAGRTNTVRTWFMNKGYVIERCGKLRKCSVQNKPVPSKTAAASRSSLPADLLEVDGHTSESTRQVT